MKGLFKKNVFIILFFSLFTCLSFSKNIETGVRFEQITFENAIIEAKKYNKLLFIDCYADWCGPCKILTRDFFTDEKVGEFYNQNFISLKMNMEEEEGIKLGELYSVTSYPTLLYINPHSLKVVYKAIGLSGVTNFAGTKS